MNEFLTKLLEAAFSLPTEPFTWLMIPVTLYWLLSLSGIFSLEWLDGADGAIDGAVDGAIDGLADGATEGLAESLGDAAADAAGEGLADAFSAGDALDAADGAVDAHANALEGHAEALASGPAYHEGAGLGDVPRTFSWSLMVIFSWLISLTGTMFVPGFQELATRGLWIALLLAAASFGLAMVATAAAMKPIQRAMSAGSGTHSRELVGETCTIRTQRVDQSFGQAEVDSGSMVIQVRSKDTEAAFRYGGKAVIYQYDPAQGVYWVTPLEPELAGS